MESCPGHFGHIALNSPVYHAGMLTYIVKILKCICFNCSKVLACKVSNAAAAPADAQKQFDNEKELESREMLLKMRSGKARFRKLLLLCAGISTCESEKGGCGYKQPKYRKSGLGIAIEYRDVNFDDTRDRKEMLWPDQAMQVLERISNEDCKLMGFNAE